MELAILVNSPFYKPGADFMDNVLAAIEKNIERNLFTVTAVTAVSALAVYMLVRQSRATKKNLDRQQGLKTLAKISHLFNIFACS